MYNTYAFQTLERTLQGVSIPIELRIAAAEGLGTMGGRFARVALIDAVKSDVIPIEVRVAAAKALGLAAKSKD
ncbi:hypothetical protein [Paraburkholderia sp. J41]|uniref:hypothetical protein n=1 Tax=Paraburkholderia sp. J41 TaxID=2805433 RepID=UPI002AC36154|nr:hypothetical protein [Paraburkholderia sp. J41]